MEYSIDDIKPVNSIENCIEKGLIFCRVLLFLNLKLRCNPCGTSIKEVSNILEMNSCYIQRILNQMVNFGLLHKEERGREVVFVPLKEIERYIPMAYEKVMKRPYKRE